AQLGAEAGPEDDPPAVEHVVHGQDDGQGAHREADAAHAHRAQQVQAILLLEHFEGPFHRHVAIVGTSRGRATGTFGLFATDFSSRSGIRPTPGSGCCPCPTGWWWSSCWAEADRAKPTSSARSAAVRMRPGLSASSKPPP